MKYKPRLGVIGLGYWGPNLVRNLENLREDCVITMFCDKDSAVLEGFCKARQQRFTTDYKEVCKDKNIDAVVVSTPTSTHYEITKYALENGKDVFCEKPITNNLRYAEEIVVLTNKNNRIMMVGNIFLYHPGVRELKKRIDSGEIGKIYEINLIRKSHGPIRSDVNVMWDLASHDISILLYLAGKIPQKISAVGFKHLEGRILEDSVDLTLIFDNGLGARINTSWLYPLKERKVIVVGDKKMAVFDDVNGDRPLTLYERSTVPFGERITADFDEFKMQTKDGDIILPKISMIEPMKIELQHFLDCIRKREKPFTDAENGKNIVKILEKAQKSLTFSGWVEI